MARPLSRRGRFALEEYPMGGGIMGGEFPEAPDGLGMSASHAMAPQASPSGFGSFMDSASQWRDENPGVLSMIGAGLMNGDLGTGFMNAAKLQQASGQRSRLRKWLIAKGISPADAEIYAAQPELLKGAMSGKSDLINAGDGNLYDPSTGEWISAPNAGVKDNRTQTEREFDRAQSDPAFADYLRTGKGRDSALMAGDRQAVRESEDAAMAADNSIGMLKSVLAPGKDGSKPLNERAGSGALAKTNAWLARNDPTGMLFDSEEGVATTELENVVLNQALASLKAIFGAAPTEGERQILVDLQASVDKTPEERKIIIGRAIQLAERRKSFYMDRANELRGGTYYQPGGGMSGADTIPSGDDGWTELGNGVKIRKKQP